MKSGVNFLRDNDRLRYDMAMRAGLAMGWGISTIALLPTVAIAQPSLALQDLISGAGDRRSPPEFPPPDRANLLPNLIPQPPLPKPGKATAALEDYLSTLPLSPPPEPIGESLYANVQTVDIDPAIIESSPVLQRWLEEIPDIATDIAHDPAFRTRLRVGYAEFPAADNTGGILVGVQDLFVGRTPLTLSAEYATNARGDRELIGIDAQYYLLPLGWYGNVAPVIGYRSITTPQFSHDGLNLGLKIILIPSRNGAADLSLTQSWVDPGSSEEIGLTTLSIGYAVTSHLRIGTDIQTQNTPDQQESRVSLLLEWLL